MEHITLIDFTTPSAATLQLDAIVKDELELAEKLKVGTDKKLAEIAEAFEDSVSWTDTEREENFPIPPTAVVLWRGTEECGAFGKPLASTYCGHVYVWLESNYVPTEELHVLGIRKSLHLVMKKDPIKVSSLLFDFIVPYAKGRPVRVQDPLPSMIPFLESRGFVPTPRWHDLSVGRIEEGDYILYPTK